MKNIGNSNHLIKPTQIKYSEQPQRSIGLPNNEEPNSEEPNSETIEATPFQIQIARQNNAIQEVQITHLNGDAISLNFCYC